MLADKHEAEGKVAATQPKQKINCWQVAEGTKSNTQPAAGQSGWLNQNLVLHTEQESKDAGMKGWWRCSGLIYYLTMNYITNDATDIIARFWRVKWMLVKLEKRFYEGLQNKLLNIYSGESLAQTIHLAAVLSILGREYIIIMNIFNCWCYINTDENCSVFILWSVVRTTQYNCELERDRDWNVSSKYDNYYKCCTLSL